MFELVSNKVTIPASSLTIPEFEKIWKRDKTKGKNIAYQELCYVYHIADFNSEYATFSDDVRLQKVLDEQIKEESWKPDQLIKDAIEKYKELKTTASMRFLMSQQELLDKITNRINSVEDDELEDEKVMNALLTSAEKANKIIMMLPKLKDQVRKEQSEVDEKIRGGGKEGLYES